MSYFRRLLTISTLLIAMSVMSFGLKAEYRFETCSGEATLKNHLGTGLDGNLSGDAEITVDNGKIKNGLNMSGDGMMSIDQNVNLDLVENLTIAFWINPSEIKKQALITKGLGSGSGRKYAANAEYFLIMQDDGKIGYKHNGSLSHTVTAFTDSPIVVNEWTHVVLTRDNSSKKMRFYVNGVANSEYSYINDPVSSNSEKVIFGQCKGCSSSYKFNGKFDEIKIYNVPLTQTQITDIYDSENSGIHSTGVCHPAPDATDDSKDLPYAGTVSIDILANDKSNDSATCSVVPSTVRIISVPADSNLSDNNKTLVVPNQGVWSVATTGILSFVSENSFKGNPTVISYRVFDSCLTPSNPASVTLTRVAAPVVTIRPSYTTTGGGSSSSGSSGGGGTVSHNNSSSGENNSTTPNLINIGNRVWLDSDKDGIQDSTEEGVNGVTVVLYDKNGSVVDRTTTDSDGLYKFLDISEGTYTIGFSSLPKNHIFTLQNIGSDDSKDSDVDSSGRTTAITIGNIKNDFIYDAGIVSTAITTGGSVVDNNDTVVADDCDCDKYKSTIPTISTVGLLILFCLISIVALLHLREEYSIKINK